MLDLGHFPVNADVQEFDTGGNFDVSFKFVWVKPRGARMVSMILIASGGGGGIPTTTGVSAAGGGGGGSSGISTLIIPAMFLPDTLYINLIGGGAPNTAASTRGSVNVCIHPTSAVANEFVMQTNNGGRGGAGGTGAAGGSISITGACAAGAGIYRGIAGNTGGSSAAASVGGSGTKTAGTLTAPGAGGGGTPAAAGVGNRGGHNTWVNSDTWPDANQVAAGGATSDGANGYWGGYGKVDRIPIRFGGTGGNSSGGSAPAAIGGSGGSAAASSYGCGGGGGGAGLTTNSNGGRGSGCYCLIISW